MKQLLLVATVATALLGASLVHANDARAAWCWPDCSHFGLLSPGTSSYNGCWYSGGEVCSGWNYWLINGIAKTCAPLCRSDGYSQALVLYGFENSARIRGRFTDYAGVYRIRPVDVGMGGYLRAQVNWWPYSDTRVSYSSTLEAQAVL